MADLIDILRDWHADAKKRNDSEADFIKQIIDEISSLRYLNSITGGDLTVRDWERIDRMASYATHKKHCAHVYGKCTCGYIQVAEEYEKVRNSPRDNQTSTTEQA